MRRDSIVLVEPQSRLLVTASRVIPWLLFIALYVLRQNGAPAIQAFGIGVALGNVIAMAALIYLFVSRPKEHGRRSAHANAVENDLGPRILLAGTCALIVLPFTIFPSAISYGLAIASAVALGIHLFRIATGSPAGDIDARLRIDMLNDILLAVILCAALYLAIARPGEAMPDGMGVTVWAVFYVMLLRSWQAAGTMVSDRQGRAAKE